MIDSITIENFRCFGRQQEARLAPLTLLVGENSTGKTSFLAMIRALWDVAYGQRVPDFKEEPYDLGSFDEIAHYQTDRGVPANSFTAGFNVSSRVDDEGEDLGPQHFETTFRKRGTRPVPTRRLQSCRSVSVEEVYENDDVDHVIFTTSRGSWLQETKEKRRFIRFGGRLDIEDNLLPMFFHLHSYLAHDTSHNDGLTSIADAPNFTEEDLDEVARVLRHYDWAPWERPFASAPVRSKPRRTYDPSRPTPDPEGDYVPMYLANLHSQDTPVWNDLRERLQRFGKDSGLFDEILIKQLGDNDGGPFQIQIKKHSNESEGQQRNLIDVGYGVSQILPLITELLTRDTHKIFLLQQPEVHLHPSAQAALGSLFCQVASPDRQLVVETHSDYVLDRIRMDIRDRSSLLTPEDVSILFFERRASDVTIHSLRFDNDGGVVNEPNGYGQFFLDEVRRSIGL